MKSRALAAAAVAAGVFFASGVQAAVITAAGSSLNQNSVTPPGADGFTFYQVEATPPANGGGGGAGTNLGTPPGYAAISTAGDSFFASGSGYPYTTLTVNGTAYKTGIAYQFPGNGNSATLATITLGGTVPASFRLGVFTDNTDNNANIASAVTIASGSSSASQTTAMQSQANDFYYFNVNGGVAGDTITVSLTQSGGAADPLGGLTFDTNTPEPASLSLLALGGLSLLARRRRA